MKLFVLRVHWKIEIFQWSNIVALILTYPCALITLYPYTLLKSILTFISIHTNEPPGSMFNSWQN